jgi:hypothetical protein
MSSYKLNASALSGSIAGMKRSATDLKKGTKMSKGTKAPKMNISAFSKALRKDN